MQDVASYNEQIEREERLKRGGSGHHISEEGAREIVGWIDKNPQFINAQNHL